MMRIALALCASLSSATLVAADDAAEGSSGVSIGTWNNFLMVTAPSSQQDDPAWAARLNQNLSGDFVDAPLSDVAAFLRQTTNCSIVIDPSLALNDPRITFKFDKMTLSSTLHWITQLGGCHYSITDGAIFFSKTANVGAPKTVLYDVSDLTMPIRDFPAPELAYNQGGGKKSQLFSKPAEPDDKAGTTLEELQDFLKSSIGKDEH
jgi:hypothetical protein